MMNFQVLLLVMVLLLTNEAHSSNILIVPVITAWNSRLKNMMTIADVLAQDGHKVTVLSHTKLKLHPENKDIEIIYFVMPEDVEVIEFKDVSAFQDDGQGNWFFKKMTGLIDAMVNIAMPFCKALLNGSTLSTLKQRNFDLVISDNLGLCNQIVIEYLDRPTMLYSNYGFALDFNIFYPYIPSFVCSPEYDFCEPENYSFKQRLINVIAYTVTQELVLPGVYKPFIDLKIQYGINTSLNSYPIKNDYVVLANIDFSLDWPRPLMPHVLPVAGVFLNDPRPLANDLLEYVHASQPEGVIVVSMGSLIAWRDPKVVKIFADALKDLPQKVIWALNVNHTETLADNIKEMSWIPQNDLLHHPSVRLFVTHCGMSGTYEAVSSGTPVVGVPWIGDQAHNCAKLTQRRGMGVTVFKTSLTAQSLRDAIQEVLGNRKYSQNAAHAQSMLSEQVVPAKQALLYWVNYTIRHEGARHLISSAGSQLSFVEYWSLDVFLCLGLLTILLTLLPLVLLCVVLRCIFRKCVSTKHKQE